MTGGGALTSARRYATDTRQGILTAACNRTMHGGMRWIFLLLMCAGCSPALLRTTGAQDPFVYDAAAVAQADKVAVDSAGTSAYHVGEPADARMQEAARRRGYALPSVARAVRDDDEADFDLILAMDRENLANLRRRGSTKARLIGEFVPGDDVPEVPDPYYGGGDGFERVLELLEEAMPALLDEIETLAERKAVA